MTGRQRFRRTMDYDRPDRVPYFEEGLRDEVLAQWRAQGLPLDADLAAMFHYDRRERIPVKLEPLPATRRLARTGRGLRELERRLDADDAARLPADWPDRVDAWRRRRHVLELPIHAGFFLTVGADDWRRFTELMYLMHDRPGLVRAAMDLHAQLSARLADRILSQVHVDFVSFSEPIGGNEGPLLSARQYRQFVLESYGPILEVLRRRRVATVCMVTYANARPLVGAFLEAGFNCLWACETAVEAMDYRGLRREFGRELRLIGGIDLDVLLRDKHAIRREILTKVPPLLADGGYIPLADGRVRANVPLENYVYYRRVLEEVTRG